MNIVFGSFENPQKICKDQYELKEVSANYKYLRSLKPIEYIIFLFLCFETGIVIFENGHKIFSLSMIFLVYIIINALITTPIHQFIQTLCYSFEISKNNIFLGFFKGNIYPTTSYFEPMNRKKTLISLITPLLLLSIIPAILLFFVGSNMYIYSMIFINTTLSLPDISLIILLITNKDTNLFIKHSNKLYSISNLNKNRFK